MARTPVTNREPPVSTSPTPRVIDFNDESPAVSIESNTDEELYETCVEHVPTGKQNEYSDHIAWCRRCWIVDGQD